MTNMENLPPLDTTAWEMWVEYRKRIKKPLKPANYLWTMRGLQKFGKDQQAVVEQSMEKEWQGLFPLKEITDFDVGQVTAPW